MAAEPISFDQVVDGIEDEDVIEEDILEDEDVIDENIVEAIEEDEELEDIENLDDVDDSEIVEEIIETDEEELIIDEEELLFEDLEDETVISEETLSDVLNNASYMLQENASMSLDKSFSSNAGNFDDDLANMIQAQEARDGVSSTMTSEGCLKRLIVFKGYDQLPSDYKAISVATDSELTILQYATQKQTEKAYKEFVALYGKENVVYDHIESVLEDYTAEDIEEQLVDLDIADESFLSQDGAMSEEDYTPEYFAKKMGANKFKSKMTASMKKRKSL